MMTLSSVGLWLLVVTGEVMIERASEVVRACDAVEAKSPRSGGAGGVSARELIRAAAAACRAYAIDGWRGRRDPCAAVDGEERGI